MKSTRTPRQGFRLAPPMPSMGFVRPALRILQVRLRAPAVLLLAALLISGWDGLRNRWDRLTRRHAPEEASMRAVSSDVEFFCPMDPGVVSGWPGRCGVCHMALVARKKGDATMLPNGVIARMQFSPYRVQLAGVLTAPAAFRPLHRTHDAVGGVDRREGRAVVRGEVSSRRAPWIATGQAVEVRSRDLPGLGPWSAKVVTLTRRNADGRELLQFEAVVDGEAPELRPGMAADLKFQILAAELEPFRSQPSDPPPRRGDEPARIYVCPDHPDSIGAVQGRCPEDQKARVMRPLGDQERVRWWCPMHPEVAADRPGSVCKACGGMELRPRIVSFRPPGSVLAVPESAVVDTGARTVVFVESMPGTFDGVEVVLGPRCGDDFPVARGLEPGQKIVIAGAFLLDAETRLNPSLAASYFGAARRAAEVSTAAVRTEADPLDSLPPADREQAKRQGVCPVTGEPLGSMGAPIRVEVGGRVVFLCCSGCEGKLKSNPVKYLGGRSQPGAEQP